MGDALGNVVDIVEDVTGADVTGVLAVEFPPAETVLF